MPDRVTGMQVFVRVVAQGSFAAAARTLSLSQTMVTRHISSLEDRLGVTLFHRSTRRLSLTEAGQIYLDGCQRLLADLEGMEQEASAGRIEPRGRLRLNVPVSFAIRYVAPVLAEFSRRYPLVHVELGLDDRVVDLIAEGWDLTLRIRQMAASSLKTRKLAAIRFVVCAAPSYLAKCGTPRAIADLEQHACLSYTLSGVTGMNRWSFGTDGSRTVPVTGPLSASNGDVLREAAIAGQGIVYQPLFIVADALRAGQLVPLVLDAPLFAGLELHAVYAPAATVPPKIRAMIDYLLECYSPHPPWETGLPEGIV
ncbi:LysR family transcriptional regulator [Acetobacter musti]|uniref:LysR family transcriptional regulator n=1 Tax=Acetobacter musti TaxID=864732 RepID=A0ABX0JL20_9PROT|nr:LysR family transcriptional regulator [Acetobacter musti]NHN84211.1 LysR family transcriptional regulator [Acetobacter musti]